MNTLLITGAAGFLGQYVARHFVMRGWSIVGVGRGQPDRKTRRAFKSFHRWLLPDDRMGELLDEIRPALFVHCAGGASVAESIVRPDCDFANGPVVVFDLLRLLRRHSPQTHFVFLSSAAVYGDPVRLPVREDAALAPLSPYGEHKVQSEALCRQFASESCVRTASVRIFSAYGPGLRRQVVWDICQKALTNREVVLRGTGEETRDFIHVADVARAIERVTQGAPFQGEAYNVASGQQTTIAELADRILERLEAQSRVRFDGVSPPGFPRMWRADISKISALGFSPSITLGDGLSEVVRWIRPRTRALMSCP